MAVKHRGIGRNTEDVDINYNYSNTIIEDCAKFVRKKITTYYVVPPEKAKHENEIWTVLYRTQRFATRKI